ncbi:MAG TPA: DMT family transporter [Ktedonobacteraceae bacterium]|nr:DMT family transporter [Ktedonobacteraceae bacterium]
MKLPQRNASLLTLFNYCAIVLIWGSFPIAAKIGVEHAPPLLLSGVRFSLAFIIMAPLAILQRNKLSISRQQHLHVFLISLLMVAIPSSIFFISTQYAPVGVLTIMWSVTPIFTALFTVREAGEVHGWKLIISLALGLAGALIVLLGHIPFLSGAASSAQLFSESAPALIAELAVLGSAAIYGFGIRLAKHSSPDMPVMVLTMWQLFYCGIFLLGMTFVFERGYVFHPTLTTFGALFYLTIFCSCISFFLLFWLIRRIGAIRTAYADFIIPGITLILSYFLLGESITFTKIIGLTLVITGVILVELA